MADLPLFQFTTQEDWYWEIPFLNADAGGVPLPLVDANGAPRVFEVLVTPATQGSTIADPVATLTMGAGNGITFKDDAYTTLVFRLPKTKALTFTRGEFTADILEVVGGERHLFMPVRLRYGEPSSILSFLSRIIGVTFSASRQPIVTPVAIAGRQGVRGPGVLNGSRAPLASDGVDGDFWIFDRTASNQGRVMYGPKAAGAWPAPSWVIQVAGIADVPGLPEALASKATPADVAAAVANLVASSPAALDTLKELADALGNDPNFATTVMTSIASKQPLDDDLTQIAGLSTKAFGRSLLTLARLADARVTPTGGVEASLGDRLAALDPGSTGFIDAISYDPALPGTSARPVSQKLAETARSALDWFPKATAKSLLGGVATGDDVTGYLQAALDEGQDIYLPSNLQTLRIQNYLKMSKPGQQVYCGSNTRILYDPPTGTPIQPMLIILPTAIGAEAHHLDFDHQAGGTRYGNPTIGGGNKGLGSAIAIMADNAHLYRPKVKNGWDNGIGVGEFGLGSANYQNNGHPYGVSIFAAVTENCGAGNHQPQGEQAGAGVNLLCAAGATVVACIDRYSRCGFVTDYAGGAGGTLLGNHSYYARLSPNPYDGYPVGGIAFYILGSDVRMHGNAAFDPEGDALAFDGFSSGSNCTGFRAKGAGKRGLLLAGRDNSVTDSRFDSCSYLNPGLYNAIEVLGTGVYDAGAYGPARGLRLSDIDVTGTTQALDVKIMPGQGAAYGSDSRLMLANGSRKYLNLCPGTWAQGSIIDPADPVGSLANSGSVEAISSRIAALAALYNA